ncbi:transposase [Streptomyces sp. FXJ1.4098]|nr:transposase [Streptomyces sp. FXJ1.4098]
MEATSTYWKPYFFLLESRGLECWLVNARDVKNVPGRPKTDRLDAVWLAKLTERGMLRPSFVPPKPVRELRDLPRARTGRHGQGQDAVPQDRHGPAIRRPAHLSQPDAAGWCAYFRPGVSSTAFQYLSSYTWGRVIFWLRRKHPGLNWKQLRRRFCGGGWWPASEERELFNPAKVRTTRYRYRGSVIPSPWPVTG